MKILLLDDEEDLLSSVARMLVLMDHEPVCFSDASEAVTSIARDNYDFAFIDYLMPDNDGIWFMEHAVIPRATKVLLMTAFVDRNVIIRMFELGATGYLIKPFDANEVKMHIAYHSHPHPAE